MNKQLNKQGIDRELGRDLIEERIEREVESELLRQGVNRTVDRELIDKRIERELQYIASIERELELIEFIGRERECMESGGESGGNGEMVRREEEARGERKRAGEGKGEGEKEEEEGKGDGEEEGEEESEGEGEVKEKNEGEGKVKEEDDEEGKGEMVIEKDDETNREAEKGESMKMRRERDGCNVSQKSPVSIEQRVVDIYKKHCPWKISDVPTLLLKFKGREEEMVLRLHRKYCYSTEAGNYGMSTASASGTSNEIGRTDTAIQENCREPCAENELGSNKYDFSDTQEVGGSLEMGSGPRDRDGSSREWADGGRAGHSGGDELDEVPLQLLGTSDNVTNGKKGELVSVSKGCVVGDKGGLLSKKGLQKESDYLSDLKLRVLQKEERQNERKAEMEQKTTKSIEKARVTHTPLTSFKKARVTHTPLTSFKKALTPPSRRLRRH